MKLSTSSSVFLATLALSSSTSTLAAPARDTQESGLTASSSFRDAPTVQESHCSAHRSQPTAARPGSLVARTDVGTLTSLIQTLLQTLLGNDAVAAAKQLSAEQLAAIVDAVQHVTPGLSPTMSKVPAPAGNALVAPFVQAEVESSATSSSAAGIFASATPTPSVAVNNVSPSSSASASASATPSSPRIPANPPNPPNTPTLPSTLPFNKSK